MRRKILISMIAIGCAVAGPVGTATSAHAAWSGLPSVRTGTSWSFSGSCVVQCAGGACKRVCEAGFVIAPDLASARREAAIRVELRGRLEGSVVSGSISVSIEARF